VAGTLAGRAAARLVDEMTAGVVSKAVRPPRRSRSRSGGG
jgi:hypothetical protein